MRRSTFVTESSHVPRATTVQRDAELDALSDVFGAVFDAVERDDELDAVSNVYRAVFDAMERT